MRLAYLPVAVWIGLMLCATLAAIRVFGHLDDDSVAGGIMRGIFHAVDWFGVVACGLAAIVSTKCRLRFSLSLLLGLAVAANLFVISPRIDGRNAWHITSERLWAGLLLGAVILALLGPPRVDSRAGNDA